MSICEMPELYFSWILANSLSVICAEVEATFCNSSTFRVSSLVNLLFSFTKSAIVEMLNFSTYIGLDFCNSSALICADFVSISLVKSDFPFKASSFKVNSSSIKNAFSFTWRIVFKFFSFCAIAKSISSICFLDFPSLETRNASISFDKLVSCCWYCFISFSLAVLLDVISADFVPIRSSTEVNCFSEILLTKAWLDEINSSTCCFSPFNCCSAKFLFNSVNLAKSPLLSTTSLSLNSNSFNTIVSLINWFKVTSFDLIVSKFCLRSSRLLVWFCCNLNASSACCCASICASFCSINCCTTIWFCNWFSRSISLSNNCSINGFSFDSEPTSGLFPWSFVLDEIPSCWRVCALTSNLPICVNINKSISSSATSFVTFEMIVNSSLELIISYLISCENCLPLGGIVISTSLLKTVKEPVTFAWKL